MSLTMSSNTITRSSLLGCSGLMKGESSVYAPALDHAIKNGFKVCISRHAGDVQ